MSIVFITEDSQLLVAGTVAEARARGGIYHFGEQSRKRVIRMRAAAEDFSGTPLQLTAHVMTETGIIPLRMPNVKQTTPDVLSVRFMTRLERHHGRMLESDLIDWRKVGISRQAIDILVKAGKVKRETREFRLFGEDKVAVWIVTL